jgi:5-methylcytosine-specific restriction endonuclease McrA
MEDTRTLLLNSWMAPHEILNWQEAITHVYKGTADVLEEYDITVSSPSVTFFVPAVMRLRRTISGVKRGVKFSRLNVFARDNFRCGYCNRLFLYKELTYDHVLPRKQGGRTVWENIVTSCRPCNARKGMRTPEQAGMRLLRRPARPHALPLHAVFIDVRQVPPVWEPYLDLKSNGHGVYVVGRDHVEATVS